MDWFDKLIDWIVLGFYAAMILVPIALMITIMWVLIHFVHKYW